MTTMTLNYSAHRPSHPHPAIARAAALVSMWLHGKTRRQLSLLSDSQLDDIGIKCPQRRTDRRPAAKAFWQE